MELHGRLFPDVGVTATQDGAVITLCPVGALADETLAAILADLDARSILHFGESQRVGSGKDLQVLGLLLYAGGRQTLESVGNERYVVYEGAIRLNMNVANVSREICLNLWHCCFLSGGLQVLDDSTIDRVRVTSLSACKLCSANLASFKELKAHKCSNCASAPSR